MSLLDTSYHDRRLRRLKRNPVFWLYYHWYFRKARRLNKQAAAMAADLAASGRDHSVPEA